MRVRFDGQCGQLTRMSNRRNDASLERWNPFAPQGSRTGKGWTLVKENPKIASMNTFPFDEQ